MSQAVNGIENSLIANAVENLTALGAGGAVIGLLIAMSFAALTVIIAKLWQFSRVRISDRRSADKALRLYRDGELDQALDFAASARNPATQVIAMTLRGQKKHIDTEKIRTETIRYGRDALDRLRGSFRLLEVCASLAPLLGLFGTVLGMITAFQALEAAGSQVDPAVLSGGIWQALLTTAVGLGVAIPVVAALTWLEGKVESLAHHMEDVLSSLETEDLSVGESS